MTTDSTTSTPGTERSGVNQQHPSPDGPGDQWAELAKTFDRILREAVPADDYAKGAHRFFACDSYGARDRAVASLIAAVRAAHPGDQWRPISTVPHPHEAGMFWAAARVFSGGVFTHQDVHLICLDDETFDVHPGYDQGWRISDYEFWQPAYVPAPPGEANSKGSLQPQEVASVPGERVSTPGDDLLHRSITALRGHIAAVQRGKRGEPVEGNPVLDCVNSLPEIVRWLDAAELEIEAAFEEYEEASPPTPSVNTELMAFVKWLVEVEEARRDEGNTYIAATIADGHALLSRAQPNTTEGGK